MGGASEHCPCSWRDVYQNPFWSSSEVIFEGSGNQFNCISILRNSQLFFLLCGALYFFFHFLFSFFVFFFFYCFSFSYYSTFTEVLRSLNLTISTATMNHPPWIGYWFAVIPTNFPSLTSSFWNPMFHFLFMNYSVGTSWTRFWNPYSLTRWANRFYN